MLGEMNAYIHEGRHGVNNLSTKFDALALDIAKRVEIMRNEISLRLDAIDSRVAKLEATDQRATGARHVVVWFLQSPLFAWVTAAAVVVWAALKDPR